MSIQWLERTDAAASRLLRWQDPHYLAPPLSYSVGLELMEKWYISTNSNPLRSA